jgi:hypothetical protein
VKTFSLELLQAATAPIMAIAKAERETAFKAVRGIAILQRAGLSAGSLNIRLTDASRASAGSIKPLMKKV